MIDHFNMFAAYNHWANQRLFDAAAEMSPEEYRQDCNVAFQSMRGTLNHILIGDTVWMGRFQNTEHNVAGLDAVLHEDRDELLDARQQMDQRISDYVAGLEAAELEEDFTYSPITLPDPVTMKLGIALSHMFNHQTHHRGQAHAILTRLKGKAPPLDLIYYVVEQQKAG